MNDILSDEQTWDLHLSITPTEDGRFARVCIRRDRPNSRVPIYLNSADSIDMLYEKVQGEFNNALRQSVNEIVQLAKQKRSGK